MGLEGLDDTQFYNPLENVAQFPTEDLYFTLCYTKLMENHSVL